MAESEIERELERLGCKMPETSAVDALCVEERDGIVRLWDDAGGYFFRGQELLDWLREQADNCGPERVWEYPDAETEHLSNWPNQRTMTEADIAAWCAGEDEHRKRVLSKLLLGILDRAGYRAWPLHGLDHHIAITPGDLARLILGGPSEEMRTALRDAIAERGA